MNLKSKNKNAIKRHQRNNLKCGVHSMSMGGIAPRKQEESKYNTLEKIKKLTYSYQLDTYVGIEYSESFPIPDYGYHLIDTTGFKVTVLPSQF
jgi:hypothetical protein